MDKLNSLQWNLYNLYQVGEWKGVQTGYDPLDFAVADHVYIENSIIPVDDSLFEKQLPSAKPNLYVTLSSLLFAGFSLYLGWKKRGWNFSERLFLGFFAFLGVILLVMWFLTDHTTTKWNFNILWANPLLFALAFARVNAVKSWVKKYVFVQMAFSAYVLLAVLIPAIGIQTFPNEIGAWLVAQLILLYRFSRITKSANG